MEQVDEMSEKGLRPEVGADSYDAVPRDGPAVFVVDAAAWDGGEIRGRWVDALASPERVAQQLGEALGRAVKPDDLAVVDQVGLGEAAISEDHFSVEHAARRGFSELTE